MTPLFRKLNLGKHTQVFVLNAPAEFAGSVRELEAAGVGVRLRPEGVAGEGFLLAFVQTLEELAALESVIAATAGDAVLWLAYPKKSSRNYRNTLSRDDGWAMLGRLGWEGVRQVAIDADWSALRFRRVEFIERLTRAAGRVLSDEGRKRQQAGPGASNPG